MDRKTIIGLAIPVLIIFCWFQSANSAFATSGPNFPSCLNPNKEPIVQYSTGIHGVPGRTESYSGEDKVYLLDGGHYLQCLCTVNGSGIHTNWWKTSSLTEEEVSSLKASGWILIPDGSLWGLEKATYMAQNIDYSCQGGSSSSSSSSNSSSSNSSDGQVQGASTTRFGQVLGLATTGTLPAIASYFVLGSILVLVSRLLKK